MNCIWKFLWSCLVSAFLFSCGETRIAEKGKKNTLEDGQPLITFSGISSTYSQDTSILLKMRAPVQYKMEDGNEVFPNGVEIDMFTETGVKKTSLVADSAVFLQKENIYRVMGNVVARNLLEDKQLESDLLNWDKNSEEIYTDAPVKIITDGQILTGKGLKAKQDFSEYEILEPEGAIPL